MVFITKMLLFLLTRPVKIALLFYYHWDNPKLYLFVKFMSYNSEQCLFNMK